MTDSTDAVPPGFEPFTRESPLLAPWRPLFSRAETDRLVIGLRVREPHCNSRGTVHGGLFAALADQAMGMSSSVTLRAGGLMVDALWTTSMTVDYLAVARLGQWLEFDTVFVKPGRTLAFAQAFVTADGQPCARANAVFKLMNADVRRTA